ncbi:Gfo/Idh/MocA family protein [Paenibacillus luteus]|uniref:Gfo/Idh/MocA family protein n=1 Tax=Paenibacillus luteus TaxID=2545753 RepID=UPI00114404A5|nr:Gfo/Idh/MocA family oxidoreductase [Paenibacillus luteus]
MRLGVIGYGDRAQTVFRKMKEVDESCQVVAVVDPGLQLADIAQARLMETAEELVRESLDGVLIGTRCSLHTEMALKVMPTGLPIYLEKPVATTMEELLRLRSGYEASSSPIVVSFPLRLTSIVQFVKEIIDSGKIGTVEHVQAVNNVPYGAVYYQSWYRDDQITGGLFLQKATHDFDYLNAILGMLPTEVCAMTSKQIFKGTKPVGLTCKTCEDNRSCPDSTAFRPDVADKLTHCCYTSDTGNEDSGSALLRYDTGMHLSYSQNFFARRGAGSRGARFLGYKGTLEFDFTTGLVRVFMHHTARVENYQFELDEDHFGGDTALAANFIELMKGETTRSHSTLEDGLASALMCLKAKESAETGQFLTIAYDH